jgi:hypothetical protein
MKSGSWAATGLRDIAYVASFWALSIAILVVTFPADAQAEKHVMTMGQLVAPYAIMAAVPAILAAISWFVAERRFRASLTLRMTVSGIILLVGLCFCAGIWAEALHIGYRIPVFSYAAGFFFADTGLLTFLETTLPCVILCNCILVWFRKAHHEGEM